MGRPDVDRFAAVFNGLTGIVLNGLAGIVVDRLAGLRIEAGRPIYFRERLAFDELSVGAVQNVVKAVAVGLRDHLAHLAADIDVIKLRDGDGVIVPAFIGDGLEVPPQLTGIDIERDDRARI